MTIGRLASLRRGGVTAAVAVLASLASPAAAGAVQVSVGETTVLSVGSGGSSGLPTVKAETPSVAGTAPVQLSAGSEGVTVASPATPQPVSTPQLPTVSTPAAPSLPVDPRTPEAVLPRVAGTATASSSSPAARGGSTASGPYGSAARKPSVPTPSGHRAATDARRAARAQGHAGAATPAPRTPAAAIAATRAAPGPGAKNGLGSALLSSRSPAAHRESSNPLSSLGSSLPLPLPVPDWSKPIILLLLLVALGLAVRWRLAARRARRLERRQGALMRDIEAMQAALVPEVPASVEGLSVSVAYRPAEGPAAGGDFYDVFSPSSGRVAVIVGDVAGHGHDALRQAALTRYTLRAFLKETGDPRATLKLAGHALSEPDAEQLATVAVALYDRVEGTLSYALAGHPPPLFAGLDAEDVPSSCSSPPVGCEMPTGRRSRTVRLPLGASACFFSDGLIEARLAPEKAARVRLLGRERLAQLLAGLGPGASAEALLAAVRDEAAATPDDMAACIVTAGGAAPAAPLDVEELEVDSRALGGGHVERYLRDSGVSAQHAQRLLREVRAQLRAHETALIVADRSAREIEVSVRAGGERPTATRLLAGASRLPA